MFYKCYEWGINTLTSDVADEDTGITTKKEVHGSPIKKRQHKIRADLEEHKTKVKFSKEGKAEKAKV